MTKNEQLHKAKRGKSKSSLEKKLDGLWTKAIHLKDNHKCIICGKPEGLNSHHIVGRRNLRLRWELYNGVLLCSLHHVFGRQSAHQDPEWFHLELEDKRWEDLQKIILLRSEEKHWTVSELEAKVSELENYINLFKLQ